MITLTTFLEKIDVVARGFVELFQSINNEVAEVKAQLENAINGNLDSEKAKEALAKLENIEQQLPKAIEQIKGLAPTIKTPEPGESPDTPVEEVEVPKEGDEVEIPIEVIEGTEGDSVGIPGLPNLDLSV